MTLAYFDCFSGISGDMILGALVDAGVSIDVLRSELARLDLRGYTLTSEKVMRSGIAATKVRVEIDEKDRRERRLADILDLIDKSTLSPSTKERSSRIFTRLAEAEANVHATTPDKVHFHEVGAVDAIVDITGSVVGLEVLGVDRIMASAVNVGSGTVQTSHGVFPVPAPATVELLTGIPLYQSAIQSELTTPTGAAVISTLSSEFGPLPRAKISRAAYGAGSRDLPDQPNVLRLLIGEPAGVYDEDMSVIIETNIDDMNPQIYDYLIERLMKAGAQDAYLTPVIMKKGRPGILLSVLTDRGKADLVLDIIFHETTSIGVRIREVGRKKLTREIEEVETQYGKVRIKIGKMGEEVMNVSPEYEDCRSLAEQKQVPLKQIQEEAKAVYLSRSRRVSRE